MKSLAIAPGGEGGCAMTAVGLTTEEQALLVLLGQCWNAYAALDKYHPSDGAEFCHHIHALQIQVAARVAYRTDPGILPRKVKP